MIRTADTPGFAGNRVGFKVLNEVAQLAEEYGPALMDRLVGPYTGRALPPLATIDLVGWDIHQAIVDNIHQLTDDEAHATLELPGYMRELIAQGHARSQDRGRLLQARQRTSGSWCSIRLQAATARSRRSSCRICRSSTR